MTARKIWYVDSKSNQSNEKIKPFGELSYIVKIGSQDSIPQNRISLESFNLLITSFSFKNFIFILAAQTNLGHTPNTDFSSEFCEKIENVFSELFLLQYVTETRKYARFRD